MYYLLNKNKVIAEFEVTEFDTINIKEVFTTLPEWISDLRTFIVNRRAPKHRENIEELLKISGCDTNKGFLDVSHALSLIDTFWAKPINSNLTWEDVSLYTHPFNETIAKTAFEGGLHGLEFSSTSPEYGTDGTYAKCWVRENGQIKLLKRGSSGACNAGLEPYSEFYASQLAKFFTDDFVSYGLRSKHGRILSVCDIFTSEQFGFLPYAAVDRNNSIYETVIELMSKYNLDDQVRKMFVFDSIIMNEDRHKNNFGFMVDNDKQEIVGMAPWFDHNLSLLPYAMQDDFEDFDNYFSMKGPRLERDFILGAKMCLTDETRSIVSQLRDFEFTRHPKYNLPEWRLQAIERIIQQNVRKILGEDNTNVYNVWNKDLNVF